MAQTVIGLFESDSDAQRAAQRLEEIGIGRNMVDVARGTGTQSDVGSNREESEGGVARFFKNLFGDNDDDAQRYSRVSSSGTSIVTVHAQSAEQAQRASELLDECGAIDVDERDASYTGREGYVSGNTGRDNYRDSDRTTDESETTISRIKEELQVGKREVESGGVRLRSRIVERPVEESIRLREEHVNIEREAVNRPVTEADRAAFQDRDIELTERAEVPVVNKEARVVEEVKISKDVTERNETIRDTVRNTEVDIDRLDENTTSREDRSGL
ncbi:MAG TPA: YsnF/AvaK domain-containing protein [Flavisolibacter sp.]|jgi:uncharacterized protein (TIGR02271 family)|nr:YsnF/AvaK domain-containing protein [Flavisolibacter sp.]